MEIGFINKCDQENILFNTAENALLDWKLMTRKEKPMLPQLNNLAVFLTQCAGYQYGELCFLNVKKMSTVENL